MNDWTRAMALRNLDVLAREGWAYDDADRVAECGRCGARAALRRTPETGAYECRPCWDRDTLGPAGGAS